MEDKKISLSTAYQIDDDSYDKTAYIKLRMKVCHDGMNNNYNALTLEAMKKAQDTIKNKPILAHVVFDDDGKPQFGGHDMRIDTDPTGQQSVRVIYEEIPIGVIPETNNYKIVKEDDGRNYVYVDGYVWKDYSNLAEYIINRDEEIKISMEIEINKYEIDPQDDLFTIVDYKYRGVTMLGNNFGTGMKNAKATKFNQNKHVYKDFASMKEEVNTMLNKQDKEERNSYMDKKLEFLKSIELSSDCVDFDFEDMSLEEFKCKIYERKIKAMEDSYGELEKEYEEYKNTHSNSDEDVQKYEDEHKYENSIVEDLQNFKKEAQANEVFADFLDLEGVEEFESLKNDMSSFDNLETLKEKCFAIRGKQVVVNKKDKDGLVKFGRQQVKHTDVYGGIFEEYGIKPKEEK